MRHTVIGSAGHIDHGKSALLLSLTGTDPDRLKEEKEREMTTDLGFVFLGDDITIIDVPGHEKFIKNMLAGVSTLDIGLLVIAADDGVMPQTVEHFEILQLLGIRKGIIALTKIDMVDAEWLELVKEDVTGLAKGTFMENAPVFPVSNRTGEGVDALKQAIIDIAATLPARADRGVFRLWIDRVFTIRGAGTIVAGTVLSGVLKPGDRVDLLPSEKNLRVKKIQVHNRPQEKCVIGERAAINLMGIDTEEINRGDQLTAPGFFSPTYMLNIRLMLLNSCPRPLKNRDRVRLHLGTAEILCRVVPLEKLNINPGGEGFVQLRLESPIVADVGDAFVIREYSPGRTIGGGTVLETHPPKLKYLPDERLKTLEVLSFADPLGILEHHLKEDNMRLHTLKSVSHDMALSPDEAENQLRALVERRIALRFDEPSGSYFVHRESFQESQENIMRSLREFHAENPMRAGIRKSELKAKFFTDGDSAFFDRLLKEMHSSSEIMISREKIAVAGYIIEFSPDQVELKAKIEKIYFDAAFQTPDFDELLEQLGIQQPEPVRETLTGMVESGILLELEVKMGKSLFFHTKRIQEAKDIVIEMLKDMGEVKFFEVRERLNSTRKFTTPILTHFDKIGLTKRVGDVRVLAKEI